MSSEIDETTKQASRQERVSLDEPSASMLDRWLEQIQREVAGIKIGRSEIVRWLVKRHATDLSQQELQEIKAEHFDEMEFALWVVRQLKESRAKGEPVSLLGLLGGIHPVQPRRKSRRQAEASQNSTEEVHFE